MPWSVTVWLLTYQLTAQQAIVRILHLPAPLHSNTAKVM